MKSRIDVLNLEWTSGSSRDRETATLICNYLRYMGYSVEEKSIFNYYYYINKYKPRLYFNTAPIGALINMKAYKYANQKGIKSVTTSAEGNFTGDDLRISNIFWGWNKEKELLEEYNLLWSKRSRDLVVKIHPELKSRIKVSGGVGADRYKIVPQIDRKKFLKKYGMEQYQKIIGVGCWDFGIYYTNHARHNQLPSTYADYLEKLREARDFFNNILNQIIENHTDILFLLKEHPGVMQRGIDSGIADTEKFSNVLILQNEEPIMDCISVSDFWVHFESTTAMEAWLMGKQTCMINPAGLDFPRTTVHKGNPNYATAKEFQNAIKYFYQKGVLPGFEALKNKRKKIIKGVYEWDDGLNHVRVGNQIITVLNKMDEQPVKRNETIHFILCFYQSFKWLVLPFFRYIPFIKIADYSLRTNFNQENLKVFSEIRLSQQKNYYRKLGLSKQKLLKVYAE